MHRPSGTFSRFCGWKRNATQNGNQYTSFHPALVEIIFTKIILLDRSAASSLEVKIQCPRARSSQLSVAPAKPVRKEHTTETLHSVSKIKETTHWNPTQSVLTKTHEGSPQVGRTQSNAKPWEPALFGSPRYSKIRMPCFFKLGCRKRQD